MGRAFGYRPGGIIGLLTLPRDQWEALEADLMNAGFTVEDYPDRLTLYTLHVFMRHSKHGSNVFKVLHGERADWGYTQELLARLIEATWDGNWQRAGRQHAPKPKPLARPWEVSPKKSQHFGDQAVSIEDFHKIWNRRAAA